MRGSRVEIGLAFLAFGLAAVWTLTRFNSNLVQSGDSFITYLPGAIAARRLDLEAFRVAMTFGVEARPPLFPLLIALVPIPVIESAHFVVAATGVLAGVLAFVLLRRWLRFSLALAGSALFVFSPAVLPYTVNTAPDVLFLCLVLGLVWAILEQRTWLVVVMFWLAIFSRVNGYLLAPFILVYFFDRRREWRRLLPYLVGLISGFALLRVYLSWVKPNTVSVTEVGAHFWDQTIFTASSTGSSFGERFQMWSLEQWWLVFVRTFTGAPFDLARHFFTEHGMVHYAGGVLLVAATAALLIKGPHRYIAAAFLYYGPLAVFHWETRYFMPIYAGLFLGGFVFLALRFFNHRAVVIGVSVVAVAESLLALHGLDRSDWRNGDLHPVQVDAERVLSTIVAHGERKPIRIYGCLYLPLMLFNSVRFERYYDLIECCDENHQNPRAWTDLDAAFMDDQRSFTPPLALPLTETGSVVMRYAGRYRLYKNRHTNLDLTRGGFKPLEIRVEKEGSNAVGWAWVVHTKHQVQQGEIVVARFHAESDGAVENLRFGYFDGEEVAERGVVKFLNIPVKPGVRTVAHTCMKPSCEVALLVQTFQTKNAKFEILGLGVYPPLSE